jgi:hydrogenase nickel incorporation protein HypA/HybF
MHEIGMCEGLLELIDQKAAGRRVTGVRLRVGARHAVVNEAFDQAFALVADGTAAQGAVLDLVVTPATVACHSCGHKSDSVDGLAVCPRCGAADVDVSGGDELVLESLQFGLGWEEGVNVPGHSG